jgi:hypothetical protein
MTILTRVPDWETKLAQYVHANLRTPFAWGEFDCCLFACNCVQAVTGTDLAADFRGRYATLADAYRLIKDYAGGGVAELADKKALEYQLPEVPLNFASPGDVVLVNQITGDALGIVDTGGVDVLASGVSAIVRVPRSGWKKAWRI